MKLTSQPEVEVRFDKYEPEFFHKLYALRQLIIDTAKENEDVTKLLETLKWGEPSYIANKGTTIRINQHSKDKSQYGMYFQCSSMMIPTIKEVHGSTFKYDGNRAILFDLEDELPMDEIKDCINMGLNYHSVKHLPLLGRE